MLSAPRAGSYEEDRGEDKATTAVSARQGKIVVQLTCKVARVSSGQTRTLRGAVMPRSAPQPVGIAPFPKLIFRYREPASIADRSGGLMLIDAFRTNLRAPSADSAQPLADGIRRSG